MADISSENLSKFFYHTTKPHALWGKKGQLVEPGWSKTLIQKYSREAIKAPKFRIKEWDYYLVQTEAFAVAMTISDLGYIGMISASFIDFTKPWEHTESIVTLAPMGKYQLPSDSKEGISEFKNERLSMKFAVENGTRHLTCNFSKFDDEKDFSCDIVLEQPKQDTLVIATPWDKKHHFYYNQKINCMPASGWAEYDGVKYHFNPETAMGVLKCYLL